MGNYKEKYEQALNRAKVINPGTADYEVAVKIFPELKDSEDEKIRKELIEFICWAIDRGSITEKQREKSNLWLAWLNKQGKQKPAWSEEDEEYLVNIAEWIYSFIDDEDCGDMTYDEHKEFYIKRINWLKSLKERMKGE